MPFIKEKNLSEDLSIRLKLVPEKDIVKMASFCEGKEWNQ
jgi:hypothetical protein